MVQDGRECAKYDCDKGTFTITLPKAKHGEYFPDLDMITSLMAVPKARAKINLIEEVSADGECSTNAQQQLPYEDDEDEIEWTFEEQQQRPPDSELNGDLLVVSKYGFANSKSNVFKSMGEEVALAVDCGHVDSKKSQVRRTERTEDEMNKFDDEYYLSCLYEEQEAVERLLDFRPYWHTKSQVELDDQDLYDLKNLSSRSYLLDKDQKRLVLLSLLDILAAYAYEMRVGEGETSPESNWTVCKLSATLSWLEDHFASVNDVAVSFMRRSLIFPLHRNYRLSQKVLEDVVAILLCGKKCVLKCLLDIRRILNSGCDSRYILNDLYINDYCVWIQKVKQSTLEKLAESLGKVTRQISKQDLDLDLVLLEKAAELAVQEQEEQVKSDLAERTEQKLKI